MGTLTIDGQPYEVDSSQNLLQVALTQRLNLPFFCWHPALGSVGACRQCAVKQYKDEKDTQGKLVMACMTQAAPGIRISIADPEAAHFRAQVIEGLMFSHPHDCPVCDEGGECHLQDMTLMSGHNYRRSRFPKRTFRNQNLGPFLNHEMNRCIQCYRCVRFYREYAGGSDLHALGIRDVVYFGRHEDGVLENEFSGNLAEVCPTGVFTDKTLGRHYTRKWDQQYAPSICVHCANGCNISPGARYGLLRRVLNRYHGEVNGWFICDRGRFGYEFVNSGKRVRETVSQLDGAGRPLSTEEAVTQLAAAAQRRCIGIGSPRASLEANFALRTLVGADRFYSGLSEATLRLTSRMLQVMRQGPARTPSMREVEGCDAVLVLGEDVTMTGARLALSLRQASRQKTLEQADAARLPRWLDHPVRELAQDTRSPFYIATPAATRLDGVATELVRASPQGIARLGYAIAHLLDPAAPAVSQLEQDERALAGRIAEALSGAKRPVVVSGAGCKSLEVVEAAANVAAALARRNPQAALSYVLPECNSAGLALMEAPGLEAAAAAMGEVESVLVLENDLTTRAPPEVVEPLLSGRHQLIVLDCLACETSKRAALLLPAATFAETEGTLVSSEGRAQRFFSVLHPERPVQESWRWLRDALRAAGKPEGAWENLDAVTAATAGAFAALAPIVNAAPGASFRMAGNRIAREPHRSSGRTAMHANVEVAEPAPPPDPDSPLAYSMEGYSGRIAPSALTPFFWWPGWNSQQAAHKFQEEVNGPLEGGDAGVRLFSPGQGGAYFDRPPPAFAPPDGQTLLVPLPRLFGSDELSRHAPAVAQRIPSPTLLLNPQDAARLKLSEAAQAQVQWVGAKTTLTLPVAIAPELPSGIAGLPLVDPAFDGLPLPAWIHILRSP